MFVSNHNLQALRAPTVELRERVERELRASLEKLAPGVNPGSLLDVWVDTTVMAHTQVNVAVELTRPFSATTRGTFAAEPLPAQPAYWNHRSIERERVFRQEYVADFLPPPPPEPFRPHFPVLDQGQVGDCTFTGDRVDALRYAIESAAPLMLGVRSERVQVPDFEIRQRPSFSLSDMQPRRFDIIDRTSKPAVPLHPWIQAVIRKKSPKRPPPDPPVIGTTLEPFRGVVPPRISVWEHLRSIYNDL